MTPITTHTQVANNNSLYIVFPSDFNKIADCKYIYRAGIQSNRSIEFQRVKDIGGTIKAVVFGRDGGKNRQISEVVGSAITVDRGTTQKKIEVLKAKRQASFQQEPIAHFKEKQPDEIKTLKGNCKLSEMTAEEQDEILRQLTSEGEWNVQVTTGFGKDPKFEKIKRLTLFKSSRPHQEIVPLCKGCIQSYKYTYGVSRQLNRAIEFLREDDTSNNINAIVVALENEKDVQQDIISKLPASQIKVDLMSTKEKIQALKAKGADSESDKKTNKDFSEMTIEEQNSIINQLEPEGPWRIEIATEFVKGSLFENIKHLKFFKVG